MLAACNPLGRKIASRDRDRVQLRLLLVSGNRSDFGCPSEMTVAQLKLKILRDWPSGTMMMRGGRDSDG